MSLAAKEYSRREYVRDTIDWFEKVLLVSVGSAIFIRGAIDGNSKSEQSDEEMYSAVKDTYKADAFPAVATGVTFGVVDGAQLSVRELAHSSHLSRRAFFSGIRSSIEASLMYGAAGGAAGVIFGKINE